MDTALFEGTLVESERILYTPSTFARTNLIHLQECGRLKALSPHTLSLIHISEPTRP